MRKLILLLVVFLGALLTQAQTITPVYFNNTATYFPGGSISIHFKPTGVFPIGTKFTLQLLDAGNNVVNPNIGSVDEFFVPVLNGVLPNGIANGTYTLRVVADNGGTQLDAITSSAFTVTAATAFTSPTIELPSTVLKVNCYTAPNNYFGFLDRGSSDITSAFTFDVPSSPGFTYSARIVNHQTSVSTALTIANAFGTLKLQMPSGLPTNYYTVEITKTDGSVSSSYSYIYLFNTGNTSLGNTSSENVCATESVTFSADNAVMGKNYPGSYYTLSYGDGTPVETKTHAQLISEPLSHTFNQPTCSDPSAFNGQFKIELYLYNKGIRVGINNNCETYTKNGNGTQKFVNTSVAPIAALAAPLYTCINNPLVVTNQSIAGAYGTTNVCLTEYNVKWYLKAPSTALFAEVPASWYANFNKDLNIPENILSEVGQWQVVITTQNPEGCITLTTDTSVFCVEPKPLPDFKMNGLDSISGCIPMVIALTDLSNANICRPFNMQWVLLDSLYNPAPAADFTLNYPNLTITKEGKYYLRFTIGNSCGDSSVTKPILLLGSAGVTLPGNTRYCGKPKEIDFAIDNAHQPTYSTTELISDTYDWVVTSLNGGTHTFTGGTRYSRYPIIRFNDYDTYTVTLTYFNNCGAPKTTTQTIIIDEPLTVNTNPSAVTVCYTETTINLAGSSYTGPADSIRWRAYAPVAPFGVGTFDPTNTIAGPVYNISNDDRTRGAVRFILQAFKPINSVCTNVSDTVLVTIRPQVIANSAVKTICSGVPVNHTPTGTPVAGTTYAWTSVASAGTITGNTSGNGAITDILVNSGTTTETVTYTITPTNSGCVGTAATLVVTVHPTPTVTVPTNKVHCPLEASGAYSFTGSVPGTTYNWTNDNTSIGLAASGSGNISSFTVTNTGNIAQVATITVTSVANGCPGTPQSFTVTVNPTPPNPAVTGTVIYCQNDIAAALPATATAGHNLLWYTAASGGTGSSVTPVISTATPGSTIYYVSQINASTNCESGREAITVTIKPTPNIATAVGTNPTNCATATGFITLTGLAPNTTYTVNYTRNSVPVSTGLTSDPSGYLVIPSLTAGVYDAIEVSLNGCPSNTMGPLTLLDPTPPAAPAAGSNSAICSGTNLTLTALSATPGVSYSWTGPNGFSSSLQNPVIAAATVAATGTYTVTVTLNSCTATGTVNVTINPTPAAPTATDVNYCEGQPTSPLTATATAGNTLLWYTAASGGTGSASAPIPSATTPGTVTYYVSQVTTASLCESARTPIAVTVNPTPAIAINASTNPTHCASSTGTIVLNGLDANTSYSVTYTKDGGIPIVTTVSSDNSGLLVISSLFAGTYTNISVTLGGCPSNMVGAVALTDPTPPTAPVAGSNGPICSGTTLNLTATAIPGASYSWSGPNGFSSTAQNPSISAATQAASGTYTVTATINNCVSAAGSVNVIINETPATPTAISNSPICSGETLNLKANSITPGTIYSWTGPNGFTSFDQNPSIANATTANSGTYTVTATLGTCTSSAATTSVTIKPVPVIGLTSFINPNTCNTATGSITLNGLDASTSYDVSYVKNGGPATTTVTLVSSASGSITIASLGAGTYTNVAVTLNGCLSASAAPFVLSDPTPPATPVASSNGPICSGGALNLFANTPTASVTYSWTGPNGFTSSDQNPSISGITMAGNGIYSVTATANGCISAAGTVSVVVNLTPGVPTVSSNSPVCSGNNLNLTATSSTPGATYSWTGPNGFTSTDQNPAITSAGIGATGIYSVTATLGSCTSAAGTVSVLVNETTTILTATVVDPATCSGNTGSIALTGLAATTSYTVSYFKGVTLNTITLSSDAAGTLTITGLSAGTYTNVSVTLNGCVSNTMAGPFTLIDPAPPATPTATGNGPICSGNAINLTSATTTPGSITYSWTGPNGFTSTDQNPFITNALVAASGTYFVTATLNGCTSAAGSVAVVVSQTTVAPVVSSNSPVCSGNDLSLTAATATPGTMTYAWTGPSGFTSNDQNPTIPNATLAAGGTYTVIATATTGNCPSVASSTVVVVNPTPVITGTSSSNPTQCASATGAITLQGLAANTAYAVTFTKNSDAPATLTLSSNGAGEIIINGLTAGNYTAISVSLSNCPSNAIALVTLTDPAAPAVPVVGSNSPICSGNDVNLTAASATPGVSYSWTGPNSFASTTQNPTITNATTDASGVYTVSVTLNNCTTSNTVSVLVNPTPPAPLAPTPIVYCQGQTAAALSATATGTNTLLWYTTATGGVGDAIAPVPSTTAVGSTTYYVSQSVTATGCESDRTAITITVKTTSTITGSSINHPISCGSNTGSIVLTGVDPLTTYSVSYVKNSGAPVTITLVSDAAGIVTIPSLTAGTYTDVSVSLANCPSNTVGPFTLNDPAPPAVPVAGSNGPICSGTDLTLSAISATAGVSYNWTGPNSFTSSVQNPTIATAGVAAAGTYAVTATLNNCTSVAGSVLVDVVALPAAPTLSSPVNYCIGTTATALTATPVAGNTLNWYTTATGGTPSAVAPMPLTTAVGTTTYYTSQSTPLGCEGSRGSIEVIINPDALAQFNYTVDTACAPFNIMAFNITTVSHPDRNSTYQWYANGVLIGNGATFPGYVLTPIGDSVLIKLSVTSPYGCKEDSLKHWFFTKAVADPKFILNTTEGCGPLLVQATNTTLLASQFNFTWDFGNGQTSNLQNPGPVTFLPNPTFNDTTYTITLSASTICDVVSYSQTIRVKSKPKSIFSPDKTFGCSPMTVVFANQSLGLNNTYNWDFGDGSPIVTTSVRGPQTHTYHTGVRDTFYARLIVVNDCGNDTSEYAIIVSPNEIQLDVAVNGTQLFGCAPHAVTFFNNSVGATSFFWNFGDGNTITTTANIGTVNHSFANAGTYIVTLRATNGCSDTTTTETITVFPTPTAAFTINRSVLCLGDTLRTMNTSVDATRYEWDFGDGTPVSNAVSPVHAYTAAGNYILTLRTYRLNPQGNECANSTTTNISVTTTATGSFTATPDNGLCAPLEVSFSNTTLPSVSTSWNFGDGSTGTGNMISHTFTTAGTYTVTLTTVVPGGCTYITPKTITVGGPSGQLLYTGGFVCDSVPVRFEVTAANTDAVTWHFGDGTSQTTSQRFVFHTYANPGAYLPHVTLNSAAGCRFVIRGVDSIRVDHIKKGYNYTVQRLCGTTRIQFRDTSTVFYGKASVTWDFGDGTTGSGSNVTHTYAISGTYDVAMTVVSNSGCSKTTITRIPVVVSSIPVATIVAPITGCAGQTVMFNGDVQSADPVDFVKWTTSTGVTSNTNPFNFSFALPGTYTVQLITGTVNGCFDTTDFHTIVINPTPTIIASNDLTLCRGGSATISATGGVQYNWTPIQGLSCTTCPNPIASPLLSTRYKVQGTNGFGCSAFDSVDVFVAQPFDVSVSENDSICVGQSSNLLATGATTYIWTGNHLSSNTVSNPVATPPLTTEYIVVGYDAFNCFTDTARVIVAVGLYPTVSLGPDLELATGTVRPMATVVTNGPIRSWLWKPATDMSCATCPLPSATIKKETSYIVKVTTAYGCEASDTLNIKAFCENVQAFVPNAFTPDGDGINDILMVRGSGIAQVKTFRIFNRWGEVVFERGNFAPNNPAYGWNGKIKGVVGPPDVYVYTAEVICENGTTYTYKGNVSVLK